MSRMPYRFAVVFSSILVCLTATGFTIPAPPGTPKKPATTVYHGTRVTDDYGWLENADDPAVRQWTEEQNRYTRTLLDQSAALPALRQRVKELMSHTSPAYFALQFRGGKLFALKHQPPKEQPFLVTLASADDPSSEQVLVDPTTDPKARSSIDFYVPSRDGRLVAVSLSEGGTEEGTVHVYEVASGKQLTDLIPRVNGATAGGSLAWNADHSGFYYTRYPRGNERSKEDLNFYQQVYFHKLGTPTGEDTYAIGKEFPRIAEIGLSTSDDGRHVLATVANGDGGEFAHYLLTPAGKWLPLTQFADQISSMAFGPDESLYLFSRKDAPRGKILRLPLAHPVLAQARTVVPESATVIDGVVNRDANFVPTPTRFYVVDQIGGPSQIRVFDHEGHSLHTVPLAPVSGVGELVRLQGDELLFQSGSFLEPPAWYRFDPAAGKATRTKLFRTSPVRFSDIEVVREFATSKDGTKVPLNILYRKGTPLDGHNPTLLTGYGGFSISMTPSFSASRKVWLEQGGVLAIANLRGGGEYGDAWHKAGNLTNKQNVFDDFAACAQHLIERKYTSPPKLALQGGSNGGLLVAAALTQQPQLFRAVAGHVGVYDMLLHDRHPNGVFNVPEYGTAKDPTQFRALYAYSPYHRVVDGTAYPAVFLLTGANDGRVDPANSHKLAARLQAATSSPLPVLLHVSSTTGHGGGTRLSEAIERTADVYAFLFQQLGVDYKPVR